MVKIIQNYALHEQIGQGQYGKVYRGIDTRTKSQIAVKVINVKKFKQYPKLQECTLNQIQILGHIECPYIIKFLQILKTANNFYFFYQFCNGGTLQSYIKQKGPLPQKKVLEFFSQMVEAFKVLVSRNIMHRDLKPSNILLHNDKIKLGDFGFCKTLENSKDLAQTMLGSPIYMAPQVLKGQIYTIKADIWSLGVVIYEMIYGFCPFQQSSIARLINVLDNREVNYNNDINKVSPQLIDLVKKMLVKDHFKRISWQQLFEYDLFNGCMKKGQKNVIQLRQNKQWTNILNRPKSKNSTFDYDYSQQKQHNSSSAKKQTSAFTKKNSAYKQNKQNSQNTIQIQQSMDTIASKHHDKLTSFVRAVFQMIQLDTVENLTILLGIKLYQFILKQHGKLPNKQEYKIQKSQLTQIIKNFEQQYEKTSQKTTYNGPLLNTFVKQVKSNIGSMTTQKKLQILKNCAKLLDFNQINSKQLKNYQFYTQQQLMNEIQKKCIKNVL